ncbi:Conserved_hypothetical protein [Hexamita inflata]|uniref:Uncharacterized protein n=1 Tax=Hexamita inflata TaxID=28002 RepID=A0AA86RST9_9EUKA|nr:Conserved hypothetical protein [Hexamita inflata]
MKTIPYITLTTAGLYVLKRIINPTKYKITEHISHDPKLNSIIDQVNSEEHKVPFKSPKSPVIQYSRVQITYPDDKFDYFHFDYVQGANPSKGPVIICCQMTGSSSSPCIQRTVSEFHEAGHSVFVLLPRGGEVEINPNQKKFRSEGYDTEDLDTLVGLVHDWQNSNNDWESVQNSYFASLQSLRAANNTLLIGFSLSSLTVSHYIDTTTPANNRGCINRMAVCFAPHDPFYSITKMPLLIRKHLGSLLKPYILKNKNYIISHGHSEDKLNQIIKQQTLDSFDQNIWCPVRNMTLYEYYEFINIQPRMKRINVPVLFVNTFNDPVVKHIPRDIIKQNDNLNLVMFNKGGHLGTEIQNGEYLVARIARMWFE